MAPRRRPRRPLRRERRRILVVTEGKVTEPEYVDRLVQHLQPRAQVRTFGVGADPAKVVRKAVELRDREVAKNKRYDKVVCLVDTDEHSTIDDARELAEDEDIMLLISNPKFEQWLLWHVVSDRRECTSVELDRQMNAHALVQQGDRSKHLANGFPFVGVDQAVELARRCDPRLAAGRHGPNPSSALPVLIDLIRGG